MSKRTKTTKPAKAVTETQQVTEVASVATKLTKRNATPVGTILVQTDKTPRLRAAQNKAAWEAVVAALPAKAEDLAKLEPLADPACVSPQAYLSYMIRRGYLRAKA